MAKATITTDGMQIKVEGTPEEITALVRDLNSRRGAGGSAAPPKRRKSSPARTSLADLLESMIDGGFFKKPRDLAGIKAALAEAGHHYPLTTLSPTMLRLVRRRSLRRMKEQKRWMYVH